MPRRVGNTIVPRNPVARSAALRRGGMHRRGRTSERQSSRARVKELLEDWREELEFERGLKADD